MLNSSDESRPEGQPLDLLLPRIFDCHVKTIKLEGTIISQFDSVFVVGLVINQTDLLICDISIEGRLSSL